MYMYMPHDLKIGLSFGTACTITLYTVQYTVLKVGIVTEEILVSGGHDILAFALSHFTQNQNQALPTLTPLNVIRKNPQACAKQTRLCVILYITGFWRKCLLLFYTSIDIKCGG
jgi:hypothetical protein